MKKTMIIAGGSGFFGSYLIDYFIKDYQIKVLTRRVTTSLIDEVEQVLWDGKTQGEWTKHLEGTEVLINLSGKSINCRFTEKNRSLLLSSRLESTGVLNEAIRALDKPPKVWLNASAGAMYTPGEAPNTEADKAFQSGFLSEMSLAWEQAFFKEELPNTRRVALRISLLLGKDGGVFPVWKKISKLLLGGKAGSGKQKVSWMHVHDGARAVEFLIENDVTGPVNFSSTNPVSNAELMRTIRKCVGAPFGFPAPAFAIKLASPIVGAEASLLLNSVNFTSDVLKSNGFVFEYDTIEKAAHNLLNE